MTAPDRLGGAVRDRMRYWPRGTWARLTWAWGGLPDPFWVEIFSSCVLLAWSGYLALHPGVLASNDAFDILERVFQDQETLVVSGYGVALAQLIAVWYKKLLWRGLAAAASGVFWLLLQVGIWASNVPTPGIMVYLGYAMMNLLTMLLLLRQPPLDLPIAHRTENE